MTDSMVLKVQQWLNSNYSGKTGYTKISEDGITGQGTITALTKALQIELGLTVDGNFGAGTYNAFSSLSKGSTKKNQVYIVQGALYCKGYNPNGFDGGFGAGVKSAIMRLESDAGLSNPAGIVTPMIMKSLLTMNAYVLLTSYNGDSKIRTIQQNLNRDYSSNSAYAKNLGLIPCDGVYTKSTNKALLYAFQIEEGLSSVDGIWGNNTKNAAPTLSLGSSKKAFVYLLQYLLYLNEFDPNGFDGGFGSGVRSALTKFQSFSALTADGICGPRTWASLFVSKGDTTRPGTCCDCSTTITTEKAATLVNNGYKIAGRYLTGRYAMTSSEINTIFNAGLNLMPIYEGNGYYANWFNYNNGYNDAKAAIKAAKALGIPNGATIYFAVDYDVSIEEITTRIKPHFKAINDVFNLYSPGYKIGIYAPRYVCTCMAEQGLTTSSFVCDMSTGFVCNLGHTLPKDWAFDQIVTKTVGSGTGAIEIDNDIASGRDSGVSYVTTGSNFEFKVDNVLIFQSDRLYRTNADGTLANDLKTNDFSKEDMLAINSLFQYQLDETSDPDILFKELKDMTTDFFSTRTLEPVILDMIDHFKEGTGSDYSNETLTNATVAHHSTQDFVSVVKEGLIDALRANGGDINALKYSPENPTFLYEYINKNDDKLVYDDISDIVNGLTITIHDIWGNNVTVNDYVFDKDTYSFSGTLHFFIYDHFGLDQPDVEKIYVDLAGFRAWFVLQHYDYFNSKYKPFLTRIEFDVPFEGQLETITQG